jgi:hypothetical protein
MFVTSLYHLSLHPHFAHILGWGEGGGGGGGEAAEVTKKSKNLVTAKTQLFFGQLLVSQPSEDFLSEAKLVEFCM